MAENLVSKFTVNSQGTDIDVKIKDTDARNLIAQEISDRSEIISKDSGGNTVLTSSDGALYINTKNPIKYNGRTVDLEPGIHFKNYILIGDSYAGGWTPDGNVTSWSTLLHGLLNGNLYGTITQGGAGLSANLTGDFNLTTKIDSFANSDDVDAIICCCGRNDISNYSIASGVRDGIKNFVNKCHEKFKNARIYIGFIGWDLNKTEYASDKSFNMSVAIANYQNVNADYTYINTDFIMRQRSFMASDGKHPNQNGQNALAYGIQCALYGGTPAFTKQLAQHTYKDIYNNNSTWMFNETFVGGTTFLQFIHDKNIMYGAGTGESVMLENYDLPIVKNVELEYLIPSAHTTMQTRILLKMHDGPYYTFDAPVHFKDNGNGTYDLVMHMTCVSHDGNSWASGIVDYFIIYDSITVANLLT